MINSNILFSLTHRKRENHELASRFRDFMEVNVYIEA